MIKNIHFWLFVSFILFVSAEIPLNKSDPKSPLYTHDGRCPKSTEKYYCLPWNVTSYSSIFPDQSKKKEIADYFNEWIQANPYFMKKIYLKYNKNNDTFSSYAKEDINQFTRIYYLNDADVLKFRKDFWYAILKKNETRFIEHSQLPEFKIPTEDHKFLFSLLYYFYWGDVSTFLFQLKILPKYPKGGLFRFSDFEVNLLKGDEAYDSYVHEFNAIMDGHKNFTANLKKYWDEDQIESVLKFSEVPIEDWVYANYVLHSHTYFAAIPSDEAHYYLPSGLVMINHIPVEKPNLEFIDFSEINETDQRTLSAQVDIDKGELIYMTLTNRREEDNPNFSHMLGSGYIPKNNLRECINVFLIDNDIAKQYKFPNVTCLGVANERLIKFHAMGNILNMNKDQYDSCMALAKSEDASYGTEEAEKLFIFNNCVHPEWVKINIWDTPVNELQTKLKMFKKKIRETQNYIALRKKHNLDFKNANLILEYFVGRTSLVKHLLRTIDQLEIDSKKFIKYEL